LHLPATEPLWLHRRCQPIMRKRWRKGLEIFKKEVGPILAENCVKCHGAKDEGEFDLTLREGLLKAARWWMWCRKIEGKQIDPAAVALGRAIHAFQGAEAQ